MSEQAILSHPYDTARLPAPGAGVTIEAGPAECAALAEAYDLLAVDALSATATLTPAAGKMVTVAGRVVANIVQSCVVSLEPVPQHIDETFQIRFVPAESAETPSAAEAAREVAIDPAAPDPPEVMEGTTIDLGALVEEVFVLAIDPYPRAPGAELPADAGDEPASEEESPFAVLRGVIRTRK
jgi:uncharacterized metal-binding protein YceD (DUF177 family)